MSKIYGARLVYKEKLVNRFQQDRSAKNTIHDDVFGFIPHERFDETNFFNFQTKGQTLG